MRRTKAIAVLVILLAGAGLFVCHFHGTERPEPNPADYGFIVPDDEISTLLTHLMQQTKIKNCYTLDSPDASPNYYYETNPFVPYLRNCKQIEDVQQYQNMLYINYQSYDGYLVSLSCQNNILQSIVLYHHETRTIYQVEADGSIVVIP